MHGRRRRRVLCKRIIPTLLCKGYNLVKGKQFSADRVVGNVIQAVEVYNLRWVDEIVLFDVEARALGRCISKDLVMDVSVRNLVPLAVGGGITTVKEAVELIQNGADKVIVGTGKRVIPEIAKEMGSQAAVACINYTTEREAVTAAKLYEDLGAGEIILQCIDRDGMMNGYDLDTAFHVASSVQIPVVLSCGAGTYQHLYEGLQLVDAVAAGAMWTFTDQTPREAKKYLKEKGVHVRTL